jgi:hypothetical protein
LDEIRGGKGAVSLSRTQMYGEVTSSPQPTKKIAKKVR